MSHNSLFSILWMNDLEIANHIDIPKMLLLVTRWSRWLLAFGYRILVFSTKIPSLHAYYVVTL